MTRFRTALVAALLALSTYGVVRGDIPAVQSGQWIAAPSSGDLRSGGASVLLPGGGVLVTGGIGDGGILASVVLFNDSGAFSDVAPMNVARTRHTATVLGDGRVLVVGGDTADGATPLAEIFSSGLWSAVGSLADARAGHTATLLVDGRVLVSGGENALGAVASVEVFDPETGDFNVVGTLTSPRKGHAAALLADGRVLMAGGFSGDTVLSSIDVFDPASNSVAHLADLNVARAGLTATTLLDGRVLFVGGNDGAADLASAEIYDSASGVVTMAGSAAVARRDHKAFLLPNNNAVLVVGGVTPLGVSASAELYLPWANGFRPTGSMAAARADGTGSPLSVESYGEPSPRDGLVLMVGGNPVASTEIYGFATIKTDKDDYAPGESVFVSGAGWQPNEVVTFGLRELPAEHESRSFAIQADEAGRIDDSLLFLVEEHHLGVRFYLSARGAASQAQTTFTDAFNVQSVTVGPQTPSPVVVGNSATYLVTVRFNGNNSSACSATLLASNLPANATASFNPTSVSSSNTPDTAVLTITTTGVTPNPSPAPLYTFTVTASMNPATGCNNSGSGTGTLRVIAPPISTTSTTLESSPASTSEYGTSVVFTATVTAPDVNPNGVGTVTFKDGATTICANVPLTGNTASCSPDTSVFRAGLHSMIAEYGGTTSGSPQFSSSSSSALAHTVTPKPLVGSFTAGNKEYDGTRTATVASTSLPGVIAPDVVTLVVSNPLFDTRNVGTDKEVSGDLSLDGSDAANYSVNTTHTAHADITPLGLTGSFTAENKVFDGTSSATVATTSLPGVIVPDDVSLEVTDAAFDTRNVGTAKTVTASLALSGADAGNYTVNATATTQADITPRPLTVTADPQTKIYGEDDPALTHQLTAGSLAAGDVLTGALSRLAGENVGDYAIQQGTLTAGANYDLVFEGAVLTITPRPITITAGAKTKTYGESDPALTYEITAGSLVDEDNLTGLLSRDPGENVGLYAITIGTVTGGSNYSLTFVGANLEITRRPVTVTAAAATKVYGEADPPLTYEITSGSLVFDDSFSGALSRAAGENVGGYAIQQNTLALGSNYELTFIGANLTITQRPITVTADSHTKLLGASDPELTYQITAGSLAFSDLFSGNLTRVPGEGVGSYAIQQGTLSAGANYALTFVPGVLRIEFLWTGFLQPINDTAHQTSETQSKFRLGQTIPAKFVLRDADGNVVLQSGNPTFARSNSIGACDAIALPEITEALTPDVVPVYKLTAEGYHYNWSTRGLSAGLYRIYANLADGTQRSVDICLTK